jgi:hypothetical protein
VSVVVVSAVMCALGRGSVRDERNILKTKKIEKKKRKKKEMAKKKKKRLKKMAKKKIKKKD